EAEPVVAAAATRDGVLLERPQTRCRLAGVENGNAGPLDGIDVASRERRNARKAAEEVERDALSGEDRALLAGHACDDRGRLDGDSVAYECLEVDLGIERPKGRLGRPQPAYDTRLLEQELGRPDCVLRNRRLGRHVAGSDVLGEGCMDDPLERVG